jgi:DNA processing protein
MTLDQAVAISLITDLPRMGLTDRLRAGDPTLLEHASTRLDRARDVQRAGAQRSIFPLAWNDPRFPHALLAIPDVPATLWYRGDVGVLQTTAVAIVGSRAASAVALETATRLAGELAAIGITVVSGLARGVDSAAHRGALRAGRTIAVLGSGIDRMYPPEHAALAGDIATRGAIVSEFPPGTPPLPFHFPLRNRIISGLSRAVIVIEASERSGSLITAECALEQGREVMAVPGNVLSGRNRGGHGLIRDGAKIVECADDIVEELRLFARPRESAADAATDAASTGSDTWIAGMAPGEAYDLDSLAAMSGLAGVELLPRLLDLELHGVLRRVAGGRFMRPIRTC